MLKKSREVSPLSYALYYFQYFLLFSDDLRKIYGYFYINLMTFGPFKTPIFRIFCGPLDSLKGLFLDPPGALAASGSQPDPAYIRNDSSMPLCIIKFTYTGDLARNWFKEHCILNAHQQILFHGVYRNISVA